MLSALLLFAVEEPDEKRVGAALRSTTVVTRSVLALLALARLVLYVLLWTRQSTLGGAA